LFISEFKVGLNFLKVAHTVHRVLNYLSSLRRRFMHQFSYIK